MVRSSWKRNCGFGASRGQVFRPVELSLEI